MCCRSNAKPLTRSEGASQVSQVCENLATLSGTIIYISILQIIYKRIILNTVEAESSLLRVILFNDLLFPKGGRREVRAISTTFLPFGMGISPIINSKCVTLA